MNANEHLATFDMLALAEIHASPTNPRKTFPEAEQGELIESVKRHGVMQPVLVRPWPEAYACEGEKPKYELVAGERRYRAAKAAALATIPGMIRNLTDEETLELQIIENLHRKDLNELEEAEGYELMIKQYGYSAEQLGEKIGKSKAYIFARRKLTAACEVARQAFRDGTIDASKLLLIARIPTAALQEKALKEITTSWNIQNYRAAAEHIQGRYMLKLADAPFPRADESLVATAGKCHPCPKRTGSTPEIYPDVKSADICTDPDCFAAKKLAWMGRQKAEAEASGKTVITGDEARKIMPYGADADLQHHVVLDRTNYYAPQVEGKHPTHRETLAGAQVEVILVEDVRSGKLVEVAKRGEVKKALQAAGVSTTSTHNEQERENEAKAREETEYRRRLHRQVRAAFFDDIQEHGADLDEDDLRLIASQFWAATWNESQTRLSAIWIESEEKIESYERNKMLAERIGTMKPAELCLLLIDLSLIGQTHVNTYSTESTPTRILTLAKRLGVSPDTIRREMQVEKEEKAAKKKGKGAKAPAAVCPSETGLKVGDRVRMKKTAVGPTGKRRKYAGHEGVIESATSGVLMLARYTVRVAPGRNGLVGDVVWNELETIVSSASETTPTPEKLAPAGDLNRVKSDQTEEKEKGAKVKAPAAKPTSPAKKAAPAADGQSSKLEVQYRHPEIEFATWSGRGKQPRWVEMWLAKGGTLEQLRGQRPAKGKARQAQIEKNEKPIAEEAHQRCTKTLDLPGLDIEMNATPIAAVTPAAHSNHAAH